MNIGILALAIALLLSAVCYFCRPQEEPQQRVDCKPIGAVLSVEVPSEI